MPKLETRKAWQVSSLSCSFKYNRAPRPAGHTYSLQRLASPTTPAFSFLNEHSGSYLASCSQLLPSKHFFIPPTGTALPKDGYQFFA